MRVLAVDPGGTTGVARYNSDEKRDDVEAFSSWELPTLPALESIHTLMRTGPHPDLVVCEMFIIGAGTAKKTRGGSYAALHSFGAVEYLSHYYGIRFEGQLPSEREFASNEKLAKLGWRHPTPGGHCDDAARHLLVACVKNQIVDPKFFLEEEK